MYEPVIPERQVKHISRAVSALELQIGDFCNTERFIARGLSSSTALEERYVLACWNKDIDTLLGLKQTPRFSTGSPRPFARMELRMLKGNAAQWEKSELFEFGIDYGTEQEKEVFERVGVEFARRIGELFIPFYKSDGHSLIFRVDTGGRREPIYDKRQLHDGGQVIQTTKGELMPLIRNFGDMVQLYYEVAQTHGAGASSEIQVPSRINQMSAN